MPKSDEPGRGWKVSEAKAKLSEVLRLSETEGPQVIGARKSYVVVPKHVWDANGLDREPGQHPPHGDDLSEHAHDKEPMPFGKWLVENVPRGTNLETPPRHYIQPDQSFDEREERDDRLDRKPEQHPSHSWDPDAPPPPKDRLPLGKWLLENMTLGIELELPERGSGRPIPFIDEDEE